MSSMAETITVAANSYNGYSPHMTMNEENIVITNGDRITIVNDEDGEAAICIQNTVWVEDPRFILFGVAGKHDREAAINELIYALERVRDRVSAGK